MGKGGGKSKVIGAKIKPQQQQRKSAEPDSQGPESEAGLWQFDCRTQEVRGAFLRCLAGIYFIAFLSIYLQADGLLGNNGVAPAKAELKLGSRKPQQCMKEKYSLLCIIPGFFGINSQHALELVALIGTMTSVVATMCLHCCTVPLFATLWVLYFSIFQVSNVFLWFQWDTLLLEAGVLGVIIAPWLPSKASMESKPRDLISLWMVKWLLFRLMFASGAVKLQSGCTAWWGLTALNYHFESQCIPTPLAYYAHNLPTWLLQLMTVGTYYVELVVPFAFFAPFKVLKRYAFWLQIIFQLSIILTGNYTFFNLLTMVLCISLLDGEFFGFSRPSPRISVTRIISRSFSYTLIGFSLYYSVKFFGVSLNDDNTIASKVLFKRVDFDWLISVAVPYSLLLGFLTLGSTVSQSVVISLFDVKGTWKKLTSLLSCIFYGGLCFCLFSVTLVPFTSLHKETNRALWQSVKDMYAATSRYHVTSSYGLFRRMTGVEKGRPEVVLEYADDPNGPWKEYHFLYKPGNTSAAPVFVAPYQPRLDWQMWFAALSEYHDNPWMLSLTYRLLQGEKSVLNLIDDTRAPSKPPKYIRSSLYHYHFTKPNSQPASKGEWWIRKREKEFMPMFSKDHPPLVNFVKNLGYLDPDYKPEQPSERIPFFLDKIRGSFVGTRPEYIIWGCFSTIFIILFTSKLFKN
ncbi:Lipase maturation factor 2 [Orchesella cincta]|uniref:Lipase maturation factor n=1 Tax=Orchesella cincta TaxID=48709 RepID=A0A1D2NFF6_ORCCI|nr:Lipase maturation factor 2 [Orchesella cincta]